MAEVADATSELCFPGKRSKKINCSVLDREAPGREKEHAFPQPGRSEVIKKLISLKYFIFLIRLGRASLCVIRVPIISLCHRSSLLRPLPTHFFGTSSTLGGSQEISGSSTRLGHQVSPAPQQKRGRAAGTCLTGLLLGLYFTRK